MRTDPASRRSPALALIATALLLHPAQARTLRVGPGKPYARLAAAAAAATAGDDILIAPGTYADCAVLRADRLTVSGDPVHPPVLAGTICDGKAILVTTGDDIVIRDLTLADARAPEGNGAGIRDESRRLTVDHVSFLDNQDGILTGAPAGASLIVRNATFLRNGACIHACAHAIYAGAIGLLRVRNSRFFETRVGHHIKSRAARTEIIGNTITDGNHGTSSYLIDIPNGGSVLIRGNTLEKGPLSQNHRAAIILGEEGVTQPSSDITIEDNSFRNDGDYATTFVDNHTTARPVLNRNTVR